MSSSLSSQESRLIEIQKLIKPDVIYGEEDLKKIISELSPEEKDYLYKINKKDAGTAVALNLTVGLGIGSYNQGDLMGGAVGSAIIAMTIISLSTGYFSLLGIPIYAIFTLIRTIDFSQKYNNDLHMLIYGTPLPKEEKK